jgi:hypothetical protein
MNIYLVVYLFIGYLWVDLKINFYYFFVESEKKYGKIKSRWFSSFITVLFDVVIWPISIVYHLNNLRKVRKYVTVSHSTD